MEMLIIRSKSKSNIRLLMELAKKMGEKPVLESSDNTEEQTLRGVQKRKSKVEKDLIQGLKEAKEIAQGKRKYVTIEQLLNE